MLISSSWQPSFLGTLGLPTNRLYQLNITPSLNVEVSNKYSPFAIVLFRSMTMDQVKPWVRHTFDQLLRPLINWPEPYGPEPVRSY